MRNILILKDKYKKEDVVWMSMKQLFTKDQMTKTKTV